MVPLENYLVLSAIIFSLGVYGVLARRNAVLILLEPRGQVRRVLDLTGAPDGVAVLERSDGEPLTADRGFQKSPPSLRGDEASI